MRTLDWKYITNLVTQIIGQNVITGLKTEFRNDNCKPRFINNTFSDRVRAAVRKMNAETLGRICMFNVQGGHMWFFGEDESAPIVFISVTRVFIDFIPVVTRKDCGEEILEEMAIATLLCVLRDIVMQKQWLSEWQASDISNSK